MTIACPNSVSRPIVPPVHVIINREDVAISDDSITIARIHGVQNCIAATIKNSKSATNLSLRAGSKNVTKMSSKYYLYKKFVAWNIKCHLTLSSWYWPMNVNCHLTVEILTLILILLLLLRAFIEHKNAHGPQVRYAGSGSVYCLHTGQNSWTCLQRVLKLSTETSADRSAAGK